MLILGGRCAHPMSPRMTRGLILGLLGTLLGAGPVQAERAAPSAQLARLLDVLPEQQARVSACVMSMPDGAVLYERDADTPLIPASNHKIFSAAAALTVLGVDYHFDTVLGLRGRDLVLIGSGDPGLGDPEIAARSDRRPTAAFEGWADLLQSRGVHAVHDIIIDDGVFDRTWTHPTWEGRDLLKWFAAPIGGLNFFDNCVEVSVWPAADGSRTLHEVVPETPWIEIHNECVCSAKHEPLIHRAPDRPEYWLRGPCNRRSTLPAVPVPDPGVFTGEVLKAILSARGVSVSGQVRRVAAGAAELPQPLHIVGTQRTSMRDVLQRSLSDSQNLFAECLLKAASRRARGSSATSGAGSWPAGERLVLDTLQSWGINTAGLSVADGSGLSRDNRATARQVAAVLRHMYLSEPEGSVFIESLSVNGTRGTLRKRMKGIPGQVHAKTGYMRGIRSMSGYVHTPDQRWYAFAVIFNGIAGGTAPYNRIHDELCRVLAGPDSPAGVPR